MHLDPNLIIVFLFNRFCPSEWKKYSEQIPLHYSTQQSSVPITSSTWQRLLQIEQNRFFETSGKVIQSKLIERERRKFIFRPARGAFPTPRTQNKLRQQFNNSMLFSVVNYSAMLTVVTTIVCLICYCCHRKIKMRSSTSSLYRQQRWLDNDVNMEIYSVEQVSWYAKLKVGNFCFWV